MDGIIDDGKHFLTRKRLNKSYDRLFADFSEESWNCINSDKGEYCLKKSFPSRIYYFFSWELRDLETKGVEKKVEKKLKETKGLQNNLEEGKKLKNRYHIDSIIIKATISLQAKLSEISEDEATAFSGRGASLDTRDSSVWSRTAIWALAKRGPCTDSSTS